MPKVKKVFIRSGIRFDYLVYDKDDTFFRELVKNHVSGQLKVAPEHCCDTVLTHMGKPNIAVYNSFKDKYFALTKSFGKEQYLVPYLMSSHPGSRLEDALELALYLKRGGYSPEQVQDFYPTPGTASTVMFYTGIDPFTGKKVFCETDYHAQQLQRALLQWSKPQNAPLVREALVKCGREDLIGYDKDCLVRPESNNYRKPQGTKPTGKNTKPSARTSQGQRKATSPKNNKKSAPRSKPARPSKKKR